MFIILSIEMQGSGKIIERKKDLFNIGDSEEFNQAAMNRALSIHEVDLSFNNIE
jgi:ATP-dependent protease HslVU (ClpYQ) peptidase subunit